MKNVEIALDHLPPPALSPNRLRTLHWSERSAIMRSAREEVGWLAKSAWGDSKPLERARISYTFFLKDRRRRDLDNLLAACKPYTDGLIDAGVIFYDDITHLEYGNVCAVHSDCDRTIITIEEIKEAN